MSTHHAASGELIDLRPLGEDLPQSASKTLVRSDHLEIFRLVMLAGKALPEHQVPSAITVQCLEGAVEIEAHGRSRLMPAGSLLYLSGGVAHALKAVQDSSILVTMLVQRE